MPTYGKFRNRIFAKGLGNFTLLQLPPVADTLFRDVGYLDNTSLKDTVQMVTVADENGNVIKRNPVSEEAHFLPTLKQTGIDEINLIKNAAGVLYAGRYYGMAKNNPQVFQYYCIENGNIIPGPALDYGKNERKIALDFICLDVSDLRGFAVPLYYVIQTDGEINVDNLALWISPRIGYNALTAKVLDISGLAQHGSLSANYATIWQAGTTPERFLRFNGTSDNLNLGDIQDDDDTTDFMIETWISTPAANSTLQEILGKKNLISDNSAGIALWRTAGNLISFKISDGSGSASVVSTATVLQSVWTHVAISIDRNGNGQVYINGSATGAAVSVASIGSAANALNLYLGAVNATEFGQVDISDTRLHRYASGMPSNIANIISNHYTAERVIHGV